MATFDSAGLRKGVLIPIVYIMIRTPSAAESRYRLATLDSLKKKFEQKEKPTTSTYEGKCDRSGCHVSVKIEKTSGGYGLLGGILCESDSENYSVLCIGCSDTIKASD